MDLLIGIFIVVALVMLAIKLWKVTLFFVGLFLCFWVGLVVYVYWTDDTVNLTYNSLLDTPALMCNNTHSLKGAMTDEQSRKIDRPTADA